MALLLKYAYSVWTGISNHLDCHWNNRETTRTRETGPLSASMPNATSVKKVPWLEPYSHLNALFTHRTSQTEGYLSTITGRCYAPGTYNRVSYAGAYHAGRHAKIAWSSWPNRGYIANKSEKWANNHSLRHWQGCSLPTRWCRAWQTTSNFPCDLAHL